MSVNSKESKGYVYSNEMTSGIRTRSGIMVLLSSGAVAFAYGMSFYFGLISSGTAVARQFPELEPIVTKLKSLLVVNTIGFIAVIILSFWLLTRMVTPKMFLPLGVVMNGLKKAVENRYPKPAETHESGPFGEFESMWNSVISETREREKHEISLLEQCLPYLAGQEATSERSSIENLIEEKKKRICLEAGDGEVDSRGSAGTDDALFMQPV
jgi:hypothetical protein